MEVIRDGDVILAIIHRSEDWKEGLDFFTPNGLFVQAGTWWYPKGKQLAAHIHKEYDRSATRTHEVVYVRKGRMRVELFNQNQKKVGEFDLGQGDLAVFANGGHGYQILEDDTQVLEVKNGPFVSVEHDKVKF